MKGRIEWIDIAKGFAIIFVVVGHVVKSYHNVHLYENSILFNFSTQFVYSFHMALFMMLSGMLVGMKKMPAKFSGGGYFRKIIAYGVPYIFFSFIWWMFKMIFSGHVNSTLTVADLLWIPLYPISFMWFVYALLLMVLIQLRIGTERSIRFKNTHLLIAFLLLLIQPFLVKAFDCISFEDLVVSDFMRMYVYFLIGVYGSSFITMLISGRHKGYIILLSGMVLFAGNILLYNDIEWMHLLPVEFVLALSGCAFFMILSIYISRFTVLSYIGKNSLSVYVLQGLSIAVVRQSMAAVFGKDLNEWVTLGVCTVMGVLIPLVMYWVSTKLWKCDFVFTPLKYIRL